MAPSQNIKQDPLFIYRNDKPRSDIDKVNRKKMEAGNIHTHNI